MKISADHSPGTPMYRKYLEQLRAMSNHRAHVLGVTSVHDKWYNNTRWANGKKQVSIHCGRDTIVWLETAIRSAPGNWSMQHAIAVRKGVMQVANKLHPKHPPWSAADMEKPIERLTNGQEAITVDMLLKSINALRLATENALDFRKDFAESLRNLHNALGEELFELRPRMGQPFIAPLDELVDFSFIGELPPGVTPDPKAPEWTPVMTPEYIAHRRKEREAWHKAHPDAGKTEDTAAWLAERRAKG